MYDKNSCLRGLKLSIFQISSMFPPMSDCYLKWWTYVELNWKESIPGKIVWRMEGLRGMS
jgi:hypothetical protein